MAIQEDHSRVYVPDGLQPGEFRFSSPEAFLYEVFARSTEALKKVPGTAEIADLRGRTIFDWHFEQGVYEQEEVGIDVDVAHGMLLVGDRFKAALVIGKTIPPEGLRLPRKFAMEFGFVPNLRDAPSDSVTTLRQLIKGDLTGSIRGRMSLNEASGQVELSYLSDIKHGPRQNKPFVLDTTSSGLTDLVATMLRFAGRVSR